MMISLGGRSTRRSGQKKEGGKSPERLAILGLLTVLVFMLAGLSIASAVVTSSNGTVNGCYKNANGTLRVQVKPCSNKETALSLRGDPVLFADLNVDGSLQHASGAVSTKVRQPGDTVVFFDRDVTGCAATASASGLGVAVTTHRLGQFGGDGHGVELVVSETASGAPASLPVDVTVTC